MNAETNYTSMSRKLSYLLIGGGIGATLALLFAPKTGSEFREDLSIAANNGLEKTKDTVNTLRENANNYYETAKDKANQVYNAVSSKTHDVAEAISDKAEEITKDVKALPETASEMVEEKVDQVNSAIEAGKNEYKKQVKSNNF